MYEKCSENMFKCGNDECIDRSLTCNLKSDCKDGSDEKPSLCGKPYYTKYCQLIILMKVWKKTEFLLFKLKCNECIMRYNAQSSSCRT